MVIDLNNDMAVMADSMFVFAWTVIKAALKTLQQAIYCYANN
jgi:hypothetical protein